MKDKKWWLLGLPVSMGLGVFLFSEHLFKMGMSGHRGQDPRPAKAQRKFGYQYYRYVEWYQSKPKEIWHIYEPKTDDTMVATFIHNQEHQSKKTVIIAHGYNGNRETMSGYAKMYYDMGFNVLMPDDRAHGQSSGKYVSFGYLDQLDYMQWIDRVIKQVGADSKILLFGVSMGGAIVSMLSGNDLPEQVQAIIADCSYSNVKDEFNYLLKARYHLPSMPFEALVSTINRHRLGYYLNDASPIHMLKKNTHPILFIHGSQDHYVPTYMCYENYRVTRAPKQMWICKGASHADSFFVNPKEYQKHVQEFLRTYFK
ncbi:alpha/beta hydrolase [Philodulcilactobacillus myokoensis]|uniref:Alpha/beta hydrolase n=1 Tax=Philodulcilactobacillus myokoensis TaxID=2929573 RepID=A0A9W6EU08_9LACO|nr:alpha/beta hydrolase [Philodulcilactobacillus myokoensis]GLB47304.1 alpha/beta hydrolase [Philodulcilactobacillus myokoensis]